MTSRQFFVATVALISLFSFSFFSLNLYLNDFGLFGDRESIKIVTIEKTSKYLMSFRYIPDNFEGILIGPSSSANLDTGTIENAKIYNMSMQGGNISELKFATDNVLHLGEIKYLIICLYPYITKNSGVKSYQIHEKEYWGSLFSMIPVKLHVKRMMNLVGLPDAFHASEWGYNDFNVHNKHIKFADIAKKIKPDPAASIVVDPVAYSELADIINEARIKGVKILAFYHPIYYKSFQNFKKSGSWEYYQGKMNPLFDSSTDIVWDMNTPEYQYITGDVRSYSDGHLSNYGAELVVEVIGKKLDALQ